VWGDASGKLNLAFEDMGQQELKNIARRVRVYHIGADRVGGAMIASQPSVMVANQSYLALPDKPSIAVLPFANMSTQSKTSSRTGSPRT
jgi:adenylate cyclase